MIINSISNNPFRILGVYSNSSLKDRVANNNRINAFAKIGKEIIFPHDFNELINDKPKRTLASLEHANRVINLDKDRLVNSLFWFINTSPYDEIALKNLQLGNIEKAKEIFRKKESFSTLINGGVLALAEGDQATGIANISKVLHNSSYLSDFLTALDMVNLTITENELSEMFITELLKEISVKDLMPFITYDNDKNIIAKKALEGPISKINQAIATAKSTPSSDADANLKAGMYLMESTKKMLEEVINIVGKNDIEYQMVADNLAKQILQCGINYYNNASETDVESPRKAMVLQSYALSIAVGQFTKDRCQENYDILKDVLDKLPPQIIDNEVKIVLELLVKILDTKKDDSTYFYKFSGFAPSRSSYTVGIFGYKEDSYTPAAFYKKENTQFKMSLYLGKIRDLVGEENKFYIFLCDKIVRECLNTAIQYVNKELPLYSSFCERIKSRMSYSCGLDSDNFRGEYADKKRAFQNNMLSVYEYILCLRMFPMSNNVKVWYENNFKSLFDLMSNICDVKITANKKLKIMSEGEFYNTCRSIYNYQLYQEIYPQGKYYKDATEQIEILQRQEQERLQLEEKKRLERQLLEDKKKQIQNLKSLEACIGFKNSNSLTGELERTLDDKAFSLCSKKDDYRLYMTKFSKHELDAEEQLSKGKYMLALCAVVLIALIVLIII